MNVLRHIDVGGTRISEIADRSRMSKQAGRPVGEKLRGPETRKKRLLMVVKEDQV